MYSVWQEKEKLQREVANLELQLKMKTKIAELDRQIKLQVSFFPFLRDVGQFGLYSTVFKLSCNGPMHLIQDKLHSDVCILLFTDVRTAADWISHAQVDIRVQ